MSRPDFVVRNVRRIHNLRKNRGMKLKDLAKRVGLNHRLLWKYEHALVLPCQENYNRLAVYFTWDVWR